MEPLGIDRFNKEIQVGDKVLGITRTGVTINIVKGIVHAINQGDWADGTRVQLMVLHEATQWVTATYRIGEKTSWFSDRNLVKVSRF